jgi:hypothetical protein
MAGAKPRSGKYRKTFDCAATRSARRRARTRRDSGASAIQFLPKLGGFTPWLEGELERDAGSPRMQQRTIKVLFEQLHCKSLRGVYESVENYGKRTYMALSMPQFMLGEYILHVLPSTSENSGVNLQNLAWRSSCNG